MRISLKRLKMAILATAMVALPIASASAQGFFGGGQQSRRDPYGQGGGEGGQSGDLDWLPPVLEGGLQLLDQLDDNDQGGFIEEGDGFYPEEPEYRPRPRPRPRPEEQPKPNVVPAKPVTPSKNSLFSARSLTPQEIAAGKAGVGGMVDNTINTMKQELPTDAQTSAYLASLGYNQAQINLIMAQMKAGTLSPGTIASLNGTTDPNAALKIGQIANANKELLQAEAAAKAGTLTTADLNQLATAMTPFVGANPQAIAATNAQLSSLGTASGLMQMLNSATPGNTTIPPGMNVLIGLVPSLPPGTIIPLGPNSALVGVNIPGGNGGPMITTGSVAQALGRPTGVDPVPESESKLVTDGVLLVNRNDNDVNYVVNGKSYTMAPGYSQALPAGRSWVVSFDRGEGAGTARYTLDTGTYAFKPADSGWDLFKQTFDVTIDNSRSTTDFNYVLNNKSEVVRAGQTKQHTSPYPMVARFDNGAGAIKQKKLEKGTFEVGVALADNSIELFDANADTQLADGSSSGGGLNLFGAAPAPVQGGLNLFGGAAPAGFAGDAPWQVTNFFGAQTAAVDESSSFLTASPHEVGPPAGAAPASAITADSVGPPAGPPQATAQPAALPTPPAVLPEPAAATPTSATAPAEAGAAVGAAAP